MKRILYWLWRVLPLPKSLQSSLMWLINTKFVAGTSVLVQNNQDQILLFKHLYRKDKPWGFPGGYVKRGENPDQAIQRELTEESGLKLKNLHLLEIIQSPEMARMEILFGGELDGEIDFTPSMEVTKAQFFSLDQLPDLIPEHQVIIKRYLIIK